MFRQQSMGVCHRCGWRGTITKVSRLNAEERELARGFGRICADCLSDLHSVTHSPAPAERAKSKEDPTRGQTV